MVQAFFPGRLNDRAAAIDGKYTFALVGLLIICPPPQVRYMYMCNYFLCQ